MSILQRIRYLGQEPGRMNLFDRFAGLEPLLDKALGLTLLDIGMGEGHIAYEFVRRGARLVHGLDKRRGKVRFARRLFLDVPVPHEFWCTDLSKARGLNRGGLLEG